jgi:hypothetical protein
LPAVAETVRGEPGRFSGVTADEVVPGPDPLALIATTVKAYETPLVRPVKLQVRALTAVQPTGGPTVGDDVTE